MSDPVHHPAHYTMGGIEVLKAIDAWGLGFCLGNTVKYIARAGKKDPSKEIEDLEKAAFYLRHHIESLKSSRAFSDDNFLHLRRGDEFKMMCGRTPNQAECRFADSMVEVTCPVCIAAVSAPGENPAR